MTDYSVRMEIFSSIYFAFACQGCLAPAKSTDVIDVITNTVSVVQDLEFPRKKSSKDKVLSDNLRLEPSSQSDSSFYAGNQIYKKIARHISQAGYSPAYQNIISKRLARKSLRQSRLPQVSNEISYTDDNDILARIDVDQVIFGNGKFSAQARVLTAEEAKSIAEYEIESNSRIEEGLIAFINAANNRRKIKEVEAFIDIYARFLEMADARVRGGVANRTELRLFELKQAQAQAERLRYVAEYKRYKNELSALIKTEFSELDFELFEQRSKNNKKTAFGKQLMPISNLPEYRMAEAEIEMRIGELDAEKASYRPELSVRASFGHDTNFGSIGQGFETDARLVLRISKPLYWGKNLDVQALGHDIQSAKTELLQTYRELSIAKNVSESLMESYQLQLDSNYDVAKLAKNRRNSFDQDFKAGAVSMAEVVSVLETAKTVQFQYLDSLFLLQKTEIEYARTLGLLGPLDIVPEFKEVEFLNMQRSR